MLETKCTIHVICRQKILIDPHGSSESKLKLENYFQTKTCFEVTNYVIISMSFFSMQPA